MVFHVGIAPLCGEMAKLNTTNLKTKVHDFREVGKNNIDEIEGMCKRIKGFAKGELGYAAIYVGSSYGNEIRQKFIEIGLESGLKKVEIIDWETQMYLNAISQAGYQPKNDDTICVLNGKLCHFWHKSNGKSEYRGSANGIFNDKDAADNSEMDKDPNVIIFEAEDENESRTVEKHFPECFVAFYHQNDAMGALIKARIMAADENVMDFDILPKLDRNLFVKVGERKILGFEVKSIMPLKQAIKLKVDESEKVLSEIPPEVDVFNSTRRIFKLHLKMMDLEAELFKQTELRSKCAERDLKNNSEIYKLQGDRVIELGIVYVVFQILFTLFIREARETKKLISEFFISSSVSFLWFDYVRSLYYIAASELENNEILILSEIMSPMDFF